MRAWCVSRQRAVAGRFNPLTATNAELIANDLPARPAGPAEVAVWKRFVTGGVVAAPSRCTITGVPAGAVPLSVIGDSGVGVMRAASVIGDAGVATNLSVIGHASVIGDASTGATGTSVNASVIGDAVPIGGPASPLSVIGDASTGVALQAGTAASAATSFNDADGTWRVTRPARGTFAGLALGRGSLAQPLVQAGSASVRGTAGSRPRYSLWWRVVPQQPARQRVSLQVTRGDTVYAHIRLTGGEALITIRDELTGAGGTYLVSLAQLG